MTHRHPNAHPMPAPTAKTAQPATALSVAPSNAESESSPEGARKRSAHLRSGANEVLDHWIIEWKRKRMRMNGERRTEIIKPVMISIDSTAWVARRHWREEAVRLGVRVTVGVYAGHGHGGVRHSSCDLAVTAALGSDYQWWGLETAEPMHTAQCTVGSLSVWTTIPTLQSPSQLQHPHPGSRSLSSTRTPSHCPWCSRSTRRFHTTSSSPSGSTKSPHGPCPCVASALKSQTPSTLAHIMHMICRPT